MQKSCCTLGDIDVAVEFPGVYGQSGVLRFSEGWADSGLDVVIGL